MSPAFNLSPRLPDCLCETRINTPRLVAIAMVDVVALTFRLLHIVFGIFWIGAVAYGIAVIRVAMPRVPFEARRETMRQLIPTIIRYVPASAVLTIIFGTLLYVHLGLYDPGNLLGSSWGQMLLAALILTLATFAYGMVAVVGTSKKIKVHLDEEACEHAAEVGALQTRFTIAQIVVLALGLVIVGVMTYVVAAL